jgi:phosphoribosylglycinamide formyltransferase-1
MYNLVVFASGSGTTLQSIIDEIKNKKLDAEIKLVVSNNPDAYALERAKGASIPTYVIKSKLPDDIDIELEEELSKYSIDLIVLAGYLKLIGTRLINGYKIINTHPSLLPKYGGKGMYGMKVHTAVIEAGEEKSGVTVHFVNNLYDKGNIIAQTEVTVDKLDTPTTLSSKVQIAEKKQLVEVLKKFTQGKL